jgi:uncharacterized protein YbbC (DUF1343 family)
LSLILSSFARVEPGIEVFLKEHMELIKGKKVGLITNHTAVDGQLRSTASLLKAHAKDFSLIAFFAPEHGFNGVAYAGEKVEKEVDHSGIPIYSLHGKTRRPTAEMLKGIDVLIYDIQDIGVRSYTYATTLFYSMEEAAKLGIEVIVLDRPNPINGILVDGPMLDAKWRSFIGYINVPYCHGMTIGELARFFNGEYKVGCKLKVVCMQGWKREMTFKDTGLFWVPPSPQIPESDTPLFYATTGLIGELNMVSIGVGYTLPFKVIGAPWIKAKEFASKLNSQGLPGVHFIPFYYRPFFGLYKGEDCQGIMILPTNFHTFRPLSTQYLVMGMLKTLYPKKMTAKLKEIHANSKSLFCKANGNEKIFSLLETEKYAAWKMIEFQKEEHHPFLAKRQKYLLY